VALELPLYLQAGVYPARLDRFLIDEVFRKTARVMRGLAVTQRAAGANFSVDISAGSAAIPGTSQADQGTYLVRSTALVNLAASATPAAVRTDSVVAHVKDPNAGGVAGDTWALEWVNGGTALPTDSLVLATIARAPGEAAILTATITDKRPLGQLFSQVGTGPPPAKGVSGDIYVQC